MVVALQLLQALLLVLLVVALLLLVILVVALLLLVLRLLSKLLLLQRMVPSRLLLLQAPRKDYLLPRRALRLLSPLLFVLLALALSLVHVLARMLLLQWRQLLLRVLEVRWKTASGLQEE